MIIQFRWVPLVNHFSVCCCRCTLRTGTLVIAWLGMFAELLQVMDSFAQLYYYKEFMREEEVNIISSDEIPRMSEDIPRMPDDNYSSLIEDNEQFPPLPSNNELLPDEDSGYFSMAETREALVFRLLFGILHLGVHSCLLYGALKEKPKFLLPFIVVQFVFLIIAFSFVVVFSLVILADDVFLGLVFFLLGGSVSVLVAYLWAGVYTYYRHLTEPSLQQQDTQLQNLDYAKPEEAEPIINPDEIQKAYANIEEKLRYNQPQPV